MTRELVVHHGPALGSLAVPEKYVNVTRAWLCRRMPAFQPFLQTPAGAAVAKAFLVDALWVHGLDPKLLETISPHEADALLEREIWRILPDGYDDSAIRLFLIRKLELIRRSTTR